MAQPAAAYVHPLANPLEGPLNQLGNLLNTNYNNSWTLKQLINANAQYILAQLDRIRQAVNQLQQNFAIARNRIPQLEAEIAALQAQLAAQGPGHAAPNVVALQQQIADLTAQRTDYIRWINESLALINRYDGYVQHINGLAPDNAQFTALIGQINQRLRTITDLFNLPQNGQDPPAPPGNPPAPPGGPYGNGGPGGLGNPALGNPAPGAGIVAPGIGNPAQPNPNFFQRGLNRIGNMFSRNRGRNAPIAPAAFAVPAAAVVGNVNPINQSNANMAGPPELQVNYVSPNPIQKPITNNYDMDKIRQMYSRPNGSPPDSDDSDEEDDENNNARLAFSRSNSGNSARGNLARGNSSGSNLKPFDDEDLDFGSSTSNRNSRFNSLDSTNIGGKIKRKRTKKHKGGFRLTSNKRTTSRSPSSSGRKSSGRTSSGRTSSSTGRTSSRRSRTSSRRSSK